MGELQAGYELVPERAAADGRDAELPRYRIEQTLGAGGFGITYLARKCPMRGLSEIDFSDMLWLDEGVPVAVKEFFPSNFALRYGDESQVSPHGDEEKAEQFELFLERFRKEAERLFQLTCLRALRAVKDAPPVRLTGTDRALVGRIREFLDRIVVDESVDLEDALDLITTFDGTMRDIAIDAFEQSPLPHVFDFFEANGTAYYVMEYLEGGSLKKLVSRGTRGLPASVPPPWSYATFAPFARKVLEALAEMHVAVPRKPLIHCDVKPENIMFRGLGRDRPVLIDVGLSRIASAEGLSSVPGFTLRYASDELAREVQGTNREKGSNRGIGPWTDIYSMAIIFAELATTGHVPVITARQMEGPRKSDPETFVPVFPEDYPPAVRRAVLHGLAMYHRDRPRSVADWEQELDLGEPEPATDTPEPFVPPVPTFHRPEPAGRRASRVPLYAATGVFLVLALAAVLLLHGMGGNAPVKSALGDVSQSPRGEANYSEPVPAPPPIENAVDTPPPQSETPPSPAPAPSNPAPVPPAADNSLPAPAPVTPPPVSKANAAPAYPPTPLVPSTVRAEAPPSRGSGRSSIGAPTRAAQFGMVIRPVSSADSVAKLREGSRGDLNDPFAVMSVDPGSRAETQGVGPDTRFARTCSGGPAAAALLAGGSVCLIDGNGTKVNITGGRQ